MVVYSLIILLSFLSCIYLPIHVAIGDDYSKEDNPKTHAHHFLKG